jgi:hypothetical protein
MPTVRVSIHLPYLLLLPPGDYPTGREGGSIRLMEAPAALADGGVETRTGISATFEAADEAGPNVQSQRVKQADRLLRHVNSLLRWYRVATGQATIVELTRAQASPFLFCVEGTSASWGGDIPLEYEAPPFFSQPPGSRVTYGQAVREGLAEGSEPDVAAMNLLDAKHALSVGRFRESVLLCWSAIDSTFVRRFKVLVDERLEDDWSEARDFLKGLDFGLRHKMTTGLRLVGARSLFLEPNGFWKALSTSYDLRNKIIHEGRIAHEDDAKLAIEVASRIVKIVASLSGRAS